MKKIILYLVILVSFFFYGPLASAVEYDISQYEGELVIHEDNTANFTESITYQFNSSYNGQYVSLGTSGNVPDGFSITGEPEVTAYQNGTKVEVTTDLESWSDGANLKIYNGGKSGDQVTVVVNWSLTNMLWRYSDVAELNWTPISDWDEPLHNVELRIKSDYFMEPSELFVHTGYFKEKAAQSFKDGVYYAKLSKVSSGSNVELHAYWDQSIIPSATTIKESRLESFLAQEKDIVKKETRLVATIYYIFPSLIVALILLSVYFFYRFKKMVDPREKQFKGRIYMYPEEYSPLVLTEYIYNLSISQLNPYYASPSKEIEFDNLVQATILDLIDRHIIEVFEVGAENHLKWVKQTDLTRYENRFLEMLFGNATEIEIGQMFSNYAFDSKVIKDYRKQYSGSRLEEEVQTAGNSAATNLDKGFKGIAFAVLDSIKEQDWDDNYRDLNSREKRTFKLATRLSYLNIVALLFMLIETLNYFLGIFFLYLLFLVLIVSWLAYIHSRYHYYEYTGVLTEGGRLRVQAWKGFRRMLKDLNHFKTSELEEVVLWNRIMVYATLFGLAKKVEHYLKVNHISMPSTSGLSAVAFHRGYISQSVYHQLTQSAISAHSASHFSLPSSSGSSSSSSGGFSGGGGGGGGGAF